ncbi:MAG TPA: ATP-binding protein [Geminicoccaceae bacterium]|nr:ATP-binding protein [Geminicoccaceae bacterium]
MEMEAPSQAASLGARRWRQLSLAERFALTGGVVMLLGMAAIGSWVASRIEDGVTRNTANATALYVESVIAPLSQELTRPEGLSPTAARALDEVLTNTPLGRRVVSFKLWQEGGRIVYASNSDLTGQVFPPTKDLRAAWSGDVVANFDALGDDEDAPERATGLPLLEIYSPIREVWSGDVIGVAEFYEEARDLKSNIFAARLESWLVVGAVTAMTAAALFGIVLGGSRTIERQRVALEARVGELALLAAQNEALRLRVQRASSRATALNEQYLRRISAELHDGPAQLVGFAALRVESIEDEADQGHRTEEAQRIRSSLSDALRELRSICRGLALPDIDDMSLSELIDNAIAAHRQRTQASVALDLDGDLGADDLPRSLRICVYRFVQEGLNNVYRHAGDVAARVCAEVGEGTLFLAVEDEGPGFAAPQARREGLGLSGLRDRVESLGGEFRIESEEGRGARIAMKIGLSEVPSDG